jgi:beta-N-acetylhexosaminidase
MSDEVLKAVNEAQTVVAAVYVVPTAGRVANPPAAVAPGSPAQGAMKNSASLADATATLLQQLLDRAAEKTVVVAVGNPYLASDFPAIQNYMCTFSNANVSEISAIKALFGEIPIRGHLPVTVPNVAQRGAGIERPLQVATKEYEHAHSNPAVR